MSPVPLCFNWQDGCHNTPTLIVQGKAIQGELCRQCFETLDKAHPGVYRIVGTVTKEEPK